mmetsp:Transcript_57725/g.150390  ORF Transcript_57725/g.150390 Transcript_57725/m.150390 type:complete len:214 (+) Transcript_57725:500-1141(+)
MQPAVGGSKHSTRTGIAAPRVEAVCHMLPPATETGMAEVIASNVSIIVAGATVTAARRIRVADHRTPVLPSGVRSEQWPTRGQRGARIQLLQLRRRRTAARRTRDERCLAVAAARPLLGPTLQPNLSRLPVLLQGEPILQPSPLFHRCHRAQYHKCSSHSSRSHSNHSSRSSRNESPSGWSRRTHSSRRHRGNLLQWTPIPSLRKMHPARREE